ncbi:hypothetical protein BC332_13829 [Capsicum chinense]|nr:hypothetical protein BC332_13829 [Capsicum chinense]
MNQKAIENLELSNLPEQASSVEIRKDIVNLIDFIERLNNQRVQITLDMDQIEKLALKVTFVSAFCHLYYFFSKGCDADIMSCISNEIHDLVQSLFHQNGDNMLLKLKYDDVPHLLENIKSYTSSHSCAESSVIITEDHLVELFDAIRVYLQYLPNCCSNLIIPSMTQYELLRNVFGNLRDFHELKVVILHDKLFVLMERVEALTKEVFVLLLNLEESTKNEENMKDTSGAILNLLENIEILKEDLKNVFLKAPADSSQLCFPTSDGPLFVTFLLKNLKDFHNSNFSTVALIKEEIRWVKEDLELVRSFFRKVEKELNRALWASVLDMGYEAEHAINSIIVRDNGSEEEKEWIFRKLTNGPADINIISIVGMPGIGKTTLDDRLYNDKSIVGHFDVRAWCTVDQEHNEKNLFQKIFNQVIGSKERFNEDGIDDNVADNLWKQLFGKRSPKAIPIYLASYPNDEYIAISDLEYLRSAEGLMEQSEVMVYVDELISSSLVVVSNERDLMPHGMTVHYDQHFPLSDVTADESFPVLVVSKLVNCTKLIEIPDSFRDIASLKFISVLRSPQLKESAFKIKENIEETTGEDNIERDIFTTVFPFHTCFGYVSLEQKSYQKLPPYLHKVEALPESGVFQKQPLHHHEAYRTRAHKPFLSFINPRSHLRNISGGVGMIESWTLLEKIMIHWQGNKRKGDKAKDRGIPPDGEIEFGIDLLLDTQSIYIPPYCMAPAELKELKEQRRWLELLKDYDMGVLYHPGKANVMVDALSRVSMGSGSHVVEGKKELAHDVHHLARLGVRLFDSAEGSIGVQSSSESFLVSEVKEKEYLDASLVRLKESVKDPKVEVFSHGRDGVLRLQGRLCVSNVDDLRQRIMAEVHGA